MTLVLSKGEIPPPSSAAVNSYDRANNCSTEYLLQPDSGTFQMTVNFGVSGPARPLRAMESKCACAVDADRAPRRLLEDGRMARPLARSRALVAAHFPRSRRVAGVATKPHGAGLEVDAQRAFHDAAHDGGRVHATSTTLALDAPQLDAAGTERVFPAYSSNDVDFSNELVARMNPPPRYSLGARVHYGVRDEERRQSRFRQLRLRWGGRRRRCALPCGAPP